MYAVCHINPLNVQHYVLNALFKRSKDALAFCNLYGWESMDSEGIMCKLIIVKVSDEELKEML